MFVVVAAGPCGRRGGGGGGGGGAGGGGGGWGGAGGGAGRGDYHKLKLPHAVESLAGGLRASQLVEHQAVLIISCR